MSDNGKNHEGDSGGRMEWPGGDPYDPVEDFRLQSVRMVRRLQKRQDWEVPERALTSIPEKLVALVESEDVSDRALVSASRVLVTMTRTNTQRDSAEHRIMVPLVIRQPEPPMPSDFSPEDEMPTAFIEQVNPHDLQETVAILDDYGLLPRYIDQIQGNGPDEPPHNGNGHLRLGKDDRFHTQE